MLTLRQALVGRDRQSHGAHPQSRRARRPLAPSFKAILLLPNYFTTTTLAPKPAGIGPAFGCDSKPLYSKHRSPVFDAWLSWESTHSFRAMSGKEGTIEIGSNTRGRDSGTRTGNLANKGPSVSKDRLPRPFDWLPTHRYGTNIQKRKAGRRCNR